MRATISAPAQPRRAQDQTGRNPDANRILQAKRTMRLRTAAGHTRRHMTPHEHYAAKIFQFFFCVVASACSYTEQSRRRSVSDMSMFSRAQ